MSDLRTIIITRVNQVPMTMWDQRSALGMARSWIDNKKPVERADPYYAKLFERRDTLAEDVVALFIESELSATEMVTALREVREEMDAPYLDDRMLGFRARRLERGELKTPGAKKKEKEAK